MARLLFHVKVEGRGEFHMKKISRITTQKRNKNRYNIFIADGTGENYGFSVEEDVLVEFHLRKGLALDDTLINTLMRRDDLHKSYSKAISYLGYRMRTEKEIRDYLIKNEVDDVHIDEIIDRLLERNLLDDEEFANAFVRTRIRTSSKGPGLVKQELRAKGVSNKYATSATELYTYGVQYDKAEEIVEKRLRRDSKNSFTRQLQQVRALLMRNGFSGDVISDVIKEVEDQKDSGEEWEAIKRQGERLFSRHSRKLTGYDLERKVKEGLYRQGFKGNLIDAYLEEIAEEQNE